MTKKIWFEPSYEIDNFKIEKTQAVYEINLLEYHFFGSNSSDWITDVDFQKVYKYLSSKTPKGSCFMMFFVPKHTKLDYKIINYSPQDVDAHWLGTYHINK
jgi:hypothetical protein|tara:strand:+ start:3236 stop:3538 length:303 start_codon:yes stop_codon:yes gene_type:complete